MEIEKQYNELVSKYTGYDCLICQNDRDQGDTCQREGLLISLLALQNSTRSLAKGRYFKVIQHLKVAPGIYRRNSDPNHWGSNPNNLSRDQRSMLEIAMASVGDTLELKGAAKYIFKRFGFHQNTHPGTDGDRWKIADIVSPSELAVYIRGLNLWYLRPALYFLDIGLLLDIYFRKNRLWDADNMLTMNILYATNKYPTCLAKLAALKHNGSNPDPMVQIEKYYTNEDNNGIPPLGDMYIDIAEMSYGRKDDE